MKAPEPHVIHPNGIYTREIAQRILSLTKTTIGRELRLRRLRCAKRAGRIFILGEWLLTWLREGEVQHRQGSDVIENPNED